ncbi:hypothetical protein EVAR_39955_1 [Eumeta japonica]|uniref:Uncharacterized protein n=1 Tax=Eumeta variegata TaxID=151549 RepID=A0A4C1X0Q6_EUMVA|nr:hypothetical protein EVAR_39955_1 [Eumeta japonica]
MQVVRCHSAPHVRAQVTEHADADRIVRICLLKKTADVTDAGTMRRSRAANARNANVCVAGATATCKERLRKPITRVGPRADSRIMTRQMHLIEFCLDLAPMTRGSRGQKSNILKAARSGSEVLAPATFVANLRGDGVTAAGATAPRGTPAHELPAGDTPRCSDDCFEHIRELRKAIIEISTELIAPATNTPHFIHAPRPPAPPAPASACATKPYAR